MELMSSLLLFTICTLATQVLGAQMDLLKLYHNHTQQKDSYHKQKQISLNMKAPSFMYEPKSKSTLDAPQDLHCHKCQSCMESAIKYHRNRHNYIVDRSFSDEDLRNGIQTDERLSDYLARSKRSTGVGPELKLSLTKDKDKEKRNRKQKYYAVTKYVRDNEVYALKIKEYMEQLDSGNNSLLHKDASKCQVYQVNNSFSCKSFEGFKLLQAAEKKKSSSRKKKHVLKKAKTPDIRGVETGQSGRTIIVL